MFRFVRPSKIYELSIANFLVPRKFNDLSFSQKSHKICSSTDGIKKNWAEFGNKSFTMNLKENNQFKYKTDLQILNKSADLGKKYQDLDSFFPVSLE